MERKYLNQQEMKLLVEEFFKEVDLKHYKINGLIKHANFNKLLGYNSFVLYLDGVYFGLYASQTGTSSSYYPLDFNDNSFGQFLYDKLMMEKNE